MVFKTILNYTLKKKGIKKHFFFVPLFSLLRLPKIN